MAIEEQQVRVPQVIVPGVDSIPVTGYGTSFITTVVTGHASVPLPPVALVGGFRHSAGIRVPLVWLAYSCTAAPI